MELKLKLEPLEPVVFFAQLTLEGFGSWALWVHGFSLAADISISVEPIPSDILQKNKSFLDFQDPKSS